MGGRVSFRFCLCLVLIGHHYDMFAELSLSKIIAHMTVIYVWIEALSMLMKLCIVCVDGLYH